MFSRVLVANRGEIALRIIRACKELGIETVAIFSEADRGAQYLELADQAICIGPAKSIDSYLRVDRVIAAAEVGNVDAIHPGYGFLAENASFNEVCRSCNFTFIGPSPEAMEKLGDKNTAREMAVAAGVPVVPVGPIPPTGPDGPEGPVRPAGPVVPVGPTKPLAPVGPMGPGNPIAPAVPAAPVNP